MIHSDIHNEKQLLQQIADGDNIAFRTLYNHYRRKTYFIAWRMLQSESDAEDVVQEIFTKLWVGRAKLPEINQFNTYLNTLIRNHVFNCLRKKANEEAFIQKSIEETDEQEDHIINSLELRELQILLQGAMNALPPQQRKVFQLGRLDGWKHDDIATEMGISKETVKKHMMAAVSTIKTLLNSKGKTALLFLLLFDFK